MNDVVIRVKSKNDAKAGIAEAQHDVQTLDRVAASSRGLTDYFSKGEIQARRTAMATHLVTRNLDEQGDQVDVLQRKLSRLAARDYNVDVNVDRDGRLSKAFSKVGGLLGGLVGNAGDAVTKIGSTFAEKLPGVLGSAVSAAGPVMQIALIGALAGVAVALASILAAMLAGAIVAALGSAVVGAGIIGAFKSDRIQEILNGKTVKVGSQALNKKGDKTPNAPSDITATVGGIIPKLKGIFEKFSAPFIDPLARALDAFDKALDRIGPKAEELGKKFAPVIDTLAPALMLMAEKAWPGIESALADSLPLFDDLADALPAIGEAIGLIFSTIHDHKDEARQGFQLLLDVVGALIVSVSTVLDFLLDTLRTVETLGKVISDSAKWGGNAFGALIDAVGQLIDRLGVALGLMDKIKSRGSGIGGAAGRAADELLDTGNAGLSPAGKATGGIAGGLTRVAERGGELLRLPQGSMVWASGQSAQMLQAGQAGGRQRIAVEVRFIGSGSLWSAFMEAQRTGEVQILSTAIA